MGDDLMPVAIDIQPAIEADIPVILQFIRALAEYEKLAHAVEATPEKLRATLFGPRPYAEILIARASAEPVGYAIFFHTYSTFLAKPGIYLEDVFVLPAHRGRGVGKALLSAVAKIARDRNCGRLEWAVLDWNKSAIDFYERLGANMLDEWKIYRMIEPAISKLAET